MNFSVGVINDKDVKYYTVMFGKRFGSDRNKHCVDIRGKIIKFNSRIEAREKAQELRKKYR